MRDEKGKKHLFIIARAGKLLIITSVMALIAGCAGQTPQITRVALLAPFEGANREIGYEALYAARLALADVDDVWVELLPIDSGNGQAADRARAFAADPLVKAAILLGIEAQEPDVQRAFGDVPVLIVGEWGANAETARTFIVDEEYPADATFRERFLTSDGFAPEPGTLAQPVYEAAIVAIAASRSGTRESALAQFRAHFE